MVKTFTAISPSRLIINEKSVVCAFGKNGVVRAEDKREGDLCTPLGVWNMRYVLYRGDRLAKPETKLPAFALTPDDGWCDDVTSIHYNQHVLLPFAASHEKLWRDDHVYDIICVLSHNDDPVVKGLGSAIFLHIARENYQGTEGCLALALDDLLYLLSVAEADTVIDISA